MISQRNGIILLLRLSKIINGNKITFPSKFRKNKLTISQLNKQIVFLLSWLYHITYMCDGFAGVMILDGNYQDGAGEQNICIKDTD